MCAQCLHYTGGGDWGLCCDLMYGLTYEYSEACDRFEQREGCVNASSYVGMFRCSRCGAFTKDAPSGVETCPSCGEKVDGRLIG